MRTIVLFLAFTIIVASCRKKSNDNSSDGGVNETPANSNTQVAPPTPTALSLDGQSSGLYLSWEAVTDADSYTVYYSTDLNSIENNRQAITGVIESNYTFTDLTVGTAYIIAVAAVNAYGESSITATKIAAAGGLVADNSFSSDGKEVFDVFVGQDEVFNAVRVVDNNELLIAGIANSGVDNDFLFMKLNRDGTLDTDFGASSGYSLVNIGANNNGYWIGTWNDKYIVSGNAFVGFTKSALSVMNSDGTLDTSSATSGIHSFDVFGTTNGRGGQFVQVDGGNYMFGHSHDGTNYEVYVVKLNADLDGFDTSYGVGGKLDLSGDDYPGFDQFKKYAVDNSGDFYICALTSETTEDALTIFKLSRDTMTLDTSFANGGTYRYLPAEYTDTYCDDIAVNSKNEIVVLGRFEDTDPYNAIIKLDTSGNPVSTFGSSGVYVHSTVSNGVVFAIDSEDNIVAVIQVPGVDSLHLAKIRDSDGSLDSQFGSSGLVDLQLTGKIVYATTDSYGRIVGVGSRNTGNWEALIFRSWIE